MAIAHEQKYGGFTYIFDIGGSYESVVELYGGRVDRIGKDGPRVNPFALEPTESNITFLYSFVKLLLTNGGAELEPEDDDVIHKAVRDMYLLDPENRRLSNLFLPKKLDRYLSKWVGKGVYSAIFDNVEDSLSLVRLQCFDFQGVNNEQYADLIEPLMVWLLRRINDVLYNPANLGVPKHILIEEIFSSMKNRQLLEGALASIKTVRKNLGGVTMIGQSAEDLGANADTIVNSCTSFLFLKGRHLQPQTIRGALQDERAAARTLRELARSRRALHSPRRIDESNYAQSRQPQLRNLFNQAERPRPPHQADRQSTDSPRASPALPRARPNKPNFTPRKDTNVMRPPLPLVALALALCWPPTTSRRNRTTSTSAERAAHGRGLGSGNAAADSRRASAIDAHRAALRGKSRQRLCRRHGRLGSSTAAMWLRASSVSSPKWRTRPTDIHIVSDHGNEYTLHLTRGLQ